MADDRIIAGLDIGTNEIRVAIGEVDVDGRVEIISTATKKSAGIRNGVIVNIEDAKDAIKEAIVQAEDNCGVVINSVIVSVGGAQIESGNYQGILAIRTSGKNGHSAVTREDMNNVIAQATAVNFPFDRQKIHVIPQEYIVDGVTHCKNPENNLGYKLEVDVHIITASKNIIQNITTCVNRAGFGLDGVMLKTLAASQAVCHEDEMELGSIIIDLGAGSTDVIVIMNEAPISTASIQAGGNLVTNDIAQVKGIPVAAAEAIKIKHGCCWLPALENDEDVILPSVGGRAPGVMLRSALCKIIEARMGQIFTMVKQAVIKNTPDSVKKLNGNIILTGAGANMEGVEELAKAVFKTPSVHIGVPENHGGIEENYKNPEFATAVGMILANKGLVERKDSKRRAKKSSGANGNSSKQGKNVFKRLREIFF